MSVEAHEATSPKGPIRSAIAETTASLSAVFKSKNLRRIQLAWAGSIIGDWAYATAVVVWAYDVGGAKAVGIWSAIRLLLMAVTSPFAASFIDRFPRKSIMIIADLSRAVIIVLATVCLWVDTHPGFIFVLATIAALLGCVFRPAQAALLPALADTPEQLTASNGASATIESLGFFAGPAIGALLLTVADVETVFLLDAATFVWSALLVWGVRPRAADDGGATGDDEDEEGKQGAIAEMLAGFSTIGRNRDLLLVAFLMAAQTLIAGAMAVFVVVLAVDVLETGPKGVGYLDSAFGVGAIIGGFPSSPRTSSSGSSCGRFPSWPSPGSPSWASCSQPSCSWASATRSST